MAKAKSAVLREKNEGRKKSLKAAAAVKNCETEF